MNNVLKSGWLPQNIFDEFEVADALDRYSSKKTSFMLEPIAFILGIATEDIENMACLLDDGALQVLPYFCQESIMEIVARRWNTSGYFSAAYQDIEGRYWQETHLLDDNEKDWVKTRKLCIRVK